MLVPTEPRDFQLQLEPYFLQETGRRLEHSPGKEHSAGGAQQELNGFLLLSSVESQEGQKFKCCIAFGSSGSIFLGSV